MKLLLITLVAGSVGATAAFVVVSQSTQTKLVQEREALKAGWAQERAALEADAAEARGRPVRTEFLPAPGSPPVVAGRAPQDLLEALKTTRIGTGPARNQSIRQVIHQLESLAEAGPGALPVIREFLVRFEDVDFSEVTGTGSGERSEPDRPGGRGRPERGGWGEAFAALAGGQRGAGRLDFLVPPSLRIGLVDVLKQIGGADAEQILGDMLGTTGRAVEVAYVARTLQEMAPDKYREVALSAAKDLLINPPVIERPSRLDQGAQGYLYGVLAMYNDDSFAANAQHLLVGGDGRVDRNALDYLTSTLRENAMPAVYQAFMDPRITNMMEKASLARQALNYAGVNQHANAVFHELISNETLPPWVRAQTVQALSGREGPFATTVPEDPAQIQARIDLVAQIPDTADQMLVRARDRTIERLSGGDGEEERRRGGRPGRGGER